MRYSVTLANGVHFGGTTPTSPEDIQVLAENIAYAVSAGSTCIRSMDVPAELAMALQDTLTYIFI